jgi:predicted Fe-Mo cluster-binding NifX family protein
MRKLIMLALGAAFLFAAPAFSAPQTGPGLVAIAANGDTASAAVSPQAGRSPFFLFFDRKGVLVEAVANPYKDAANAGIPSVDFVASKGANALVAESFGGRIVEVMKDKGVRPVEFKGSAQDAAKKALEPR